MKPTPNKPIFYPASYLVMTVTSLLLIGAVTGLGSIIIHYWLEGASNILTDTVLLYWVASLVVLLPMHLLAYWQVRHTDKSQVTTFSVRFAHGLLGTYLLITVGSFIILCTWLVALWLNVWLGTGEVNNNLWAVSLSLLLSIGWLKYNIQHFLGARTDQSQPKYYVLTVGILSIVLLILGLVFPAMGYRDIARDFVKENDLNKISQTIGDYVEQHEALPTKLTDVNNLGDTAHRLSNYEYTPRGGTKFGIFGYTLCATFAKSNDKGHDTGFGFSSHSAGKQCFTRTTISFDKFNQDLTKDMKNGTAKLQTAIQNFLMGAKQTVDQEITGVESFAGGQVKQLERNLEGLEGGTTELQQEMERLEGNLTGLEGDTGDLAGDFAEVEKFLHDLGCLFGGCKSVQ